MVDVNNSEGAVSQVAELLHNCKDLLFITGAGISADSGLPTYRGVGGLYDVDTTEVSPLVDFTIRERASVALDAIWRRFKESV